MNASLNLDAVRFDKDKGTVVVVAQDVVNGRVLMVANADREALECTIETGEMHYRSRTRGLWRKGATSGNTQAVRAVRLDCDQDAILVRVDPAGPACHTGARSCFLAGEALLDGPPTPGETLAALERVLQSRKQAAPEGSYTARLFADETLRHKKVGEEAAELVIASLRGNRQEIAHEAADLLYHALVLLRSHDMGLDEVAQVLRAREGKPRR